MFDTCPDPRLERRRKALVDAALGLFLRKGYERTTLAEVVTDAGGSLTTLYKLFGNKEGLLTAVALENAESGVSLIAAIEAADMPPDKALHHLAKRLTDQLLEPEKMSLLRIVIERSLEDPEFARDFYTTTMAQTRIALERLFERWQAQGVPFTGSPCVLSDMFLSLVLYDRQMAAITHCDDNDDRSLADRIEFFLRGAGFNPAV